MIEDFMEDISIERYPAYKVSGVELIGAIPSQWDTGRLKNLVEMITGFPFKSNKYSVSGIKLARGINVKEGVLNWDETRYWPQVENNLSDYLLAAGDILIAMDGSKVGKNFCMISDNDLPILLLQRVARLRARRWLFPRFLFYSIADKNFLLWVEISKTDPMVPHIAPSDIHNFIVPIPPFNEQVNIANFLDHKTALIDQAISIKEKQIDLLKERRQLLIHRAVTRGLNPNVKMKDSGLEWIGDIPEGWTVTSVKHVLEIPICDGPHTTPQLYEEGYPFVSAEAIKNGEVDFGKIRGFISLKSYLEFSKKYSPKRNDIYMVKSGATTGNVAMVKTDLEFSIWSPLAVFRANQKKVIPNYLLNYLESPSFRLSVELNWSFGTQQNIGMGILSNLPIAYPSLDEQILISEYIRRVTDKVKSAISLKEQEIEKLKEYRASLINSAVTGKIKVC